jgi:2-C-methyl-D-erythritol 4-phosphate cytidylyltransferase
MAAGINSRMHRQDLPRQFLPLGEKPILIHTLEQFFVNPKINRLVIIVPREWKQYTEDLMKQHKIFNKNVVIVCGGINKTESIKITVDYISDAWGIESDDALIVHDGIRPFVTQRLIDEHIETLKHHEGASTAILSNDFIIASDDGKSVNDIAPYGKLLAEQTPQSYSLNKLNHILNEATQSGISLSNEPSVSRLWIRFGCAMKIVQGEYYNMKIINPYDLEVANALLKERNL